MYKMSYLQVKQLIAELNEILAHDVVDEGGMWKRKLRSQSQDLFEFLPLAIQEQLLLERDPHGNVQVFSPFFFCKTCNFCRMDKVPIGPADYGTGGLGPQIQILAAVIIFMSVAKQKN